MEHFRPLVITDLSAEDLEDIRLIGKMKVYAVGSVTGGPASTGHNSEFTTSVDDEGLTNPKWNTRMDFRLHEPSLQNNLLHLNIAFYCSRTLGDRDVGGVTVPVKPLFDKISGNRAPPPQTVRYPVVRSSGGEQGFVKFSFAFGQPSPQSGPQQPVPQRPQQPQPPRTPPPPAAQRQVLQVQQFLGTRQQEVLQVSGNSPYSRGNPGEPLLNVSGTNDQFLGTRQQEVPQVPGNSPYPRGNTGEPLLYNTVSGTNDQFLGTRQQEALQVSGNSPYPRGNTGEPLLYNSVSGTSDPSMKNEPTVAGYYQPQNPANDPADGQVNANPYDNTSGARKNDLDENNEVPDYDPEAY